MYGYRLKIIEQAVIWESVEFRLTSEARTVFL